MLWCNYIKLFPLTLPLGGIYGLYNGCKSYYLLEKEIINNNFINNNNNNFIVPAYIKYSYISNSISLGVLSGFIYPITFLYILTQYKK